MVIIYILKIYSGDLTANVGAEHPAISWSLHTGPNMMIFFESRSDRHCCT